MKKIKPLFGIMALMFLFVSGCDPREETKQPAACFDFFPTTEIKTGDEITFTNCSTDAETYEWNFDDGSAISIANNPTHEFDTPGEYNVTLTVQNKNLKDQISKKVIVESNITACFTFSPSIGVVNEPVSFTNCSEGADSYEWYQIGYSNIISTNKDPVLTFPSAGTFEIKLIAKAGSSTDEVIHQITIKNADITIDPTVYDQGPIWVEEYFNDFSTTGDWFEGTGDDYQLSISGGYYTMIDNNNASDHYGYYITNDAVQTPDGNYDLEAWIRNTVDNEMWGSGLVFGASDAGYNYFKFSIGLYRIGDTGDGNWQDWTATSYGYTRDWNLLTVRKYLNKYYFFINQVFLYSDDYNYFGNEFGFAFDQNTTVDIDEVGIWSMDLSGKKSAGIKHRNNTVHNSNTSKLKPSPKDFSPLR